MAKRPKPPAPPTDRITPLEKELAKALALAERATKNAEAAIAATDGLEERIDDLEQALANLDGFGDLAIKLVIEALQRDGRMPPLSGYEWELLFGNVRQELESRLESELAIVEISAPSSPCRLAVSP